MTKKYRTPFSYFDLIESFPKGGCPMCRLLLRDVDWYLDSLLYEYANTTNINDSFRAMRGLCNEHGWKLKQTRGGVLGVAILYDAVLDEVLKTMAKETVESLPASWRDRLTRSGPKHSAGSLADKLESTGSCLVCDVMDKYEQEYIEVFVAYLLDPRLHEAYAVSEGLCLPHFRLALRQASDQERLEKLISIQSAIWKKLKDEVQEFIRKNNFQFADEPMGEEGDSWLRAIARVSGERGAFGQRREPN